MEDSNNNERLLWKFIDGECNVPEKRKIADRVEADPAFRRMLQELNELHATLCSQPLSHPSPAFADRVMQSVSRLTVPASPGKYLHSYVIFSLFMVFLVLIIYAILLSDPAPIYTDLSVTGKISVPSFLICEEIKSSPVYLWLANVVLALAIVDKWLRLKFPLDAAAK